VTGDQHTDNISNGHRVSRHSLPTLLYFLFFPSHIFFNSILASHTFAFISIYIATLRPKQKSQISHRIEYHLSQAESFFTYFDKNKFEELTTPFTIADEII
jgi:hypothetical protein